MPRDAIKESPTPKELGARDSCDKHSNDGERVAFIAGFWRCTAISGLPTEGIGKRNMALLPVEEKSTRKIG
jgi:hypothetical protein